MYSSVAWSSVKSLNLLQNNYFLKQPLITKPTWLSWYDTKVIIGSPIQQYVVLQIEMITQRDYLNMDLLYVNKLEL